MAAGRGLGRVPRASPVIVSVAGPSGAGKTRLILRLLPALAVRGLRVAAMKHTRHRHPLDVRGKDTERYRRAGAVAAALAGPGGVAFFGPPVDGPAALARLFPGVDLILAEGFRGAALPRIEVYRRSVGAGSLAATDPHVFAVVGETEPPRVLPRFRPDEVEPLAELICRRFGFGRRGPGLPGGAAVRSVPPGRSKPTSTPGRTQMPKTTSRRRPGRTAKRSRSEAGRKGGRATLRARGPEFFSEIGRKGGKSRSRNAAAARAKSRGRTARRAAKPGTRRRASRTRGG